MVVGVMASMVVDDLFCQVLLEITQFGLVERDSDGGFIYWRGGQPTKQFFPAESGGLENHPARPI